MTTTTTAAAGATTITTATTSAATTQEVQEPQDNFGPIESEALCLPFDLDTSNVLYVCGAIAGSTRCHNVVMKAPCSSKRHHTSE
jgi:hypothetical protein